MPLSFALVVNAHAGGVYYFEGSFWMVGEHYQYCPNAQGGKGGVGGCEMCGHYNTTFAVYNSPDMVAWTLVTKDAIPSPPGGPNANMYTPQLASKRHNKRSLCTPLHCSARALHAIRPPFFATLIAAYCTIARHCTTTTAPPLHHHCRPTLQSTATTY